VSHVTVKTGQSSSFCYELAMITIKPLHNLSWPEIERIVTGYDSTEKYAVHKIEDELQILFEIELEPLLVPYHKSFVTDETTYHILLEAVGEGFSLGAYDEQRLVGVAITEPRRWNNSLWVWEFDIEASYRRQGVGRLLMGTLVERSRQAGFRCIVCETQNTNVPAIRFYRQLGFELEGVDLSYYTNRDVSDFEVAFFMKRKLDELQQQGN
jgi:ribosomal protein S18 acetylase RimI-like enzyme